MVNEMKAPEIRFEKFNKDWKMQLLCDLMDFSNGINAPKEKYGKGRKMISVLDMLSVNPLSYDGIIGSVEVDSQTETNKRVEKGDMVFVRSSEVVSEVGWAKAYNDEIFALYSGFTIRGKKKAGFDNRFIEMTMNTRNRKQIELKSGGSTRFNVNQSILSEVKLLMPELDEQNELGDFFHYLDYTIATKKQQHEKTLNIKKAMLEKMFPKKGATVPEIRFDGFADDWEQMSLGDVLVINSGRDYKHLNHGDIPVYGTGGYMLSVDEFLSEVDAIGIGRKGTIDKPQFLSAPFWTVDTLFYMTPLNQNDLRFLFSLSQIIEWTKMDESTGLPSLSKVNIEKVVVYIPKAEEQNAIGNFFHNLDTLIEAEQQELEKLQNIKTACLGKMFV